MGTLFIIKALLQGYWGNNRCGFYWKHIRKPFMCPSYREQNCTVEFQVYHVYHRKRKGVWKSMSTTRTTARVKNADEVKLHYQGFRWRNGLFPTVPDYYHCCQCVRCSVAEPCSDRGQWVGWQLRLIAIVSRKTKVGIGFGSSVIRIYPT